MSKEKVIPFVPKEGAFLLPFEEDANAHEEDPVFVDLATAEGKALSLLGCLHAMCLNDITGREFWEVFREEPARSAYAEWLRHAHALLGDILAKRP